MSKIPQKLLMFPVHKGYRKQLLLPNNYSDKCQGNGSHSETSGHLMKPSLMSWHGWDALIR